MRVPPRAARACASLMDPCNGVRQRMHSTKSQILAALKRQGGCSVDELAAALGLAPMTVRQHLATLERDALVGSTEERQRLGRPHFVYTLTEKGEGSFHQHYDRIALQLLDEVGRLDSAEIAGLSAEEKTALLFDKLADRFIARHAAQLERLPLSQRVAAVAELLHAESGFAEWAATERGFEIRDYNCFYRKLNGEDGAPCRWHERVLSGLLACAVHCEGGGPRAAHLCRFAVAKAETQPFNGAHPLATESFAGYPAAHGEAAAS
ncbi:MAG TPA: winged helix-turn-helix transcriptional regulator [Dehalococcoidia bacterium]|nr:winged helix-turn-helix transcriptional regulator [Dehalococcoidia bacterium]